MCAKGDCAHLWGQALAVAAAHLLSVGAGDRAQTVAAGLECQEPVNYPFPQGGKASEQRLRATVRGVCYYFCRC